MRPTNFLVLVLCCLGSLPGHQSQVPGWGTLHSIGKLRYNQSSFYMFEHQYEKNGIYGGIDTRWPNGIIPFNYDETGVDPSGNRFDKKWQAIQTKGFEAFMNNTCLRFVPRTTEKDYLTYIFGKDTCHSQVGRNGGQQFVNMQGWCLPDIHETLHAIGFDHEENRRDRDYYLAFNWSNIKPNTPADDAASNGWYQKSNRPTYGTILDPKSIMTSSEWNGRIDPAIKTFIFKDGSNPDMNSAYKYYSEGDRLKVNRMFNCNPEDTCWDEDPNNCPVWASAGACQDPKWVPKNCPRTCCYDRSKNCINDNTHCHTSDWETWCNQTCNQCPSTKDSRDDCTYIAATLGCGTDHPVGIEKYCRKSCGICKRPTVVKIKPMILTKCMKTCNYWCQQKDGCKVPYPVFTDNVPSSTCRGDWSNQQLLDWCKQESGMYKDCKGTCYALGYREKCPAECVDEDPANCPKLAATKGCFSLYDGASIILN